MYIYVYIYISTYLKLRPAPEEQKIMPTVMRPTVTRRDVAKFAN